MNESLFGITKTAPAEPAQQDAAAPDKAQQSPLQEDAVPVQLHEDAAKTYADPPPSDEEFVLSVNDIGVKLAHLGISKSKDSIQRYCRDGLLEWRKLGMFNRYFVTERSVERLIEKLLLDEAASNGMPKSAASSEDISNSTQVNAAAPARNINPDGALHDAAPKEPVVHAAAHSSEFEAEPLVIELRKAIDRMEEDKKFLQEELADRRQQTKALSAVIDAFQKNAERALEEQKASGTSTYSAEVVPDEGEVDNEQNQNSEGVVQ